MVLANFLITMIPFVGPLFCTFLWVLFYFRTKGGPVVVHTPAAAEPANAMVGAVFAPYDASVSGAVPSLQTGIWLTPDMF
jgi:hypothetical protein